MAARPPAVPNSAQAILHSFLDQYGLASLATWAWSVYTHAGGGQGGLDAVTAELPNTAEFKARFPAIATRSKAGLAPISPADYVNYENGLRQAFVQYGIQLPITGNDFNRYVSALLTKDVSLAEVVNDRIRNAYSEFSTAPADVRTAFTRLYGVGVGDKALITYLLDPKESLPVLTRQVSGAQIAGAAARFGMGDITLQRAAQLTALGNTQAGIGNLENVAKLSPLFNENVGENVDFTAQQQGLGAAFGEGDAQLELEKRLQERRSAFEGGGGAASSGQVGVYGLGSANESDVR